MKFALGFSLVFLLPIAANSQSLFEASQGLSETPKVMDIASVKDVAGIRLQPGMEGGNFPASRVYPEIDIKCNGGDSGVEMSVDDNCQLTIDIQAHAGCTERLETPNISSGASNPCSRCPDWLKQTQNLHQLT